MRQLVSALLHLALLAGAQDEPRCVTPCGMQADLEPAQCRLLGLAEKRALFFLSVKVPEFWPTAEACEALQGWTLRVQHHDGEKDKKCGDDAFDITPLGCVYGATKVHKHEIILADEKWFTNALTHEIAHVLDEAFRTTQGKDHCGWGARGINGAIRLATGSVKTIAFDESCE